MSRGLTLGLCLASAVAVASVRSSLATTVRHVKATSDVYVLPPPAQVVTLSLGYRAALADVLWAHVLVSQGLHTMERRRFENLSLFLDSINELDPTFRDPYLLASVLFTFQSSTTPREEVLKARAVMERGVSVLPLDGELWLALGQYVAYLGPSLLPDPAEQAAWRLDGARMLSRAVELAGNDPTIGWRALAGASMLGRAGERDAQIRFLRRALATNDDPEFRERVARQLVKLGVAERFDAIDALRRRDLPFVSLDRFLVLAPPVSPYACAGPERAEAPGCALTFGERAARERGGE